MRTENGAGPRVTIYAAALVSVLAMLLGQGALGPVPAANTPVPRIDYVALGDSYSAGPLIPAQELAAGLCFRSTNNYPSVLARALHVASFADVTCTAARTSDLTEPTPGYLPGTTAPPQLDALGEGTDLVTLGIGGNDFGLFTSIFERCPMLFHQDPGGSPCRRAFTEDGVDTGLQHARDIEGYVAQVLAEVRRRAPNAEIWVVGYPRLLPAHGTCEAVPFARGDYRWSDRVERAVNASLRAAAGSAGAGYVDLYAASTGHDACAGGRAWINGEVEQVRRAAAYHPFREGMAGAAEEILRRIGADSALPVPEPAAISP